MGKELTVYVSGLYSGTNPQPGIGIARSLRAGHPQGRLIGVEYSNRCSGIHWTDFDDIWLQRPWTELDLARHGEDIRDILNGGAYWISSIDLEIEWLSDVFPHGHPNLLVPSRHSLEEVGKPAIPAHTFLPVAIPDFVDTEISDWELHAFCRKHDWKVWLKGPYYEAVRTPSWGDLEHWRRVLGSAWATEKLFLQRHVTGYEESVMLSAYQGELLDCVYMRKRDVTELGKTWAGDVRRVEPELVAPLRTLVREIGWTGGAEIEMIRDPDDKLWLLELNPRFPAWVHGSTIAGHNLPATLVEAASHVSQAEAVAVSHEFTRIVVEVPVKPEFPLSPLAEPLGGAVGHSMKHPSGLIEFAQRRRDDRETDGASGATPAHVPVPATYLNDLNEIDIDALETPASLFFRTTAADTFANVRQSVDTGSPLAVTPAYSIKTNPDERLLKLALKSGFLAEAISSLEAAKAVDAGFKPEQIVLNGPAKWWQREYLPDGMFHGIFCDSIDEFRRVCAEVTSGSLRCRTLGVRLRTPNIASRFGVPIDSPQLFGELIAALREMPRSMRFGVHFHMASSGIGVGRWRHLLDSMLRWCGSIEALTGRVIRTVDIGGGWFPGDTEDHGGRIYGEIAESVRKRVPAADEIICEPGKALAQPSMGLAMSVLEVRRYTEGACEVVMDGSIAELPMHFFQPHRILTRHSETDNWEPLTRGDGLLLGRLCMEHDIVAANVSVPESTKAGDVFIFCDAGAYDRSMSYVFGRG